MEEQMFYGLKPVCCGTLEDINAETARYRVEKWMHGKGWVYHGSAYFVGYAVDMANELLNKKTMTGARIIDVNLDMSSPIWEVFYGSEATAGGELPVGVTFHREFTEKDLPF